MTPKPLILLVDDDTDITELLSAYLARFDFEVHCASDGVAMRAQLTRLAVDLVVLDVMLPGTDGMALAREIRHLSQIPVIMLTARVSTLDRIIGLESGADDYMTKPFEPRELVARIQSVLRRSKPANDGHASVGACDIVAFDGWELRRNERTVVSPNGVVVALSNAEFRLLNTFLQTPRRLFSRDQLMAQARGRSMDSFDRSIDLLVSRLRQKLTGESAESSMIKTVRGAGYLFNVRSVQGRVAWQA
ncbi:MAG: response regulator transcription factor [Hylemonella sp.]|nr:response regulator transcription factor [Hylemonella sp.]